MNSTFGALDAAPRSNPPPGGEMRRAAFFGLDKTLIPGSSLFLLAQGLRQRDFYGPAELLRFAWHRLRFRVGGPEAVSARASSQEAALQFVLGRHRPDVQALAREIAGERIVPEVYPDMAVLIAQLRNAGVLTFVATAGPVELAEIVAEGLGMTGGLGTQAEVDDGDHYSGRLAGLVLHGAAKASAVEAHAAASGIDLRTSVAYSDSINDLPLLELVGRAEVVNPDRKLRKVADARGWPVRELRGGRRSHRRMATAHVVHRLAALELDTPLRLERDATTRRQNHEFTTDDATALISELEATGRFRRDSRLGGLFHPGKISLREVASTNSLHITVEEQNRVSAHVDRYSPLARSQPDHRPRYSLPGIAAHNITAMAADVAQLIPGRRRRCGCVPPLPDAPAGTDPVETAHKH